MVNCSLCSNWDGGGLVGGGCEAWGEGPVDEGVGGGRGSIVPGFGSDTADGFDEGLSLLIEEVTRGGVGFNDDGDGGDRPDELNDDDK